MGANVATEYGDISRAQAAHVVKKALDHAEPVLVLQKFGQIHPIPKNKSEKIHWRRPVPFAAATTPLTEGVTPAAKQMQYERIEATLNQYGDVVELTDRVSDLAEDPVLAETSELLGEQAAETTEKLLWGILRAGTSVFYDTKAHTARNEVNTPITRTRQDAIVRFLKAQKGKKHTKMLSGSVKVGTVPIRASYVAFAHTDIQADIESMEGFVPVESYGTTQPLCAEELGAVGEVRYIISPTLDSFADAGGAKGTMVSTTGTSADVYPIIFVARNSFGIVPLSGKEAVHPYVLKPGVARGGDPLGQRGTIGWKTYWQGKILNELWMARLEVGATDL